MKFINNKGLAVITVLGVMLVLLIMGIAFITTSKISRKVGTNHLAMIKARNAAEAGLEHALAMIQEDTFAPTRRVDSYQDFWAETFYDVEYYSSNMQTFKTKKITHSSFKEAYYVMVEDEAGKININSCAYNTSSPVGSALRDIDINEIGINNEQWRNSFINNNDRRRFFPEDIFLYNHKPLPGDRDFPYEEIRKYITAKSYSWMGEIVNLYDFWSGPVYGSIVDDLINMILKYGPSNLDVVQTALNMKDTFDQDSFYTERNGKVGKDAGVFINEVMPGCLTDRTNEDPRWVPGTGWFIEVYNPYRQGSALYTDEYSRWKLKWETGGAPYMYGFERDMQAGEYFILTDDTGRFEAEFGITPNRKVHSGFIVQGADKIELLSEADYLMDQIDISGVAYDNSVEKNDPRSSENSNLIVQSRFFATPGAQNNSFNIPWPSSDKAFFLNDGTPAGAFDVTALSALKYIYADKSAWQYINLRYDRDANGNYWVNDSNHNGLLDDSEAECFSLLKGFYDYDNALPDFYDDIDGRGIGYSRFRLSGRININTASFIVLSCLPGGTRAAGAIINHRRWLADNNDYPYNRYNNIYDVIIAFRAAGFSDSEVEKSFEDIVNLITVESNVFKITVTGVYLDSYECTLVALV
ncbi:MAG: pilus assembly PilX N-terminal domain-containing protein, partial [Elusimicrobiota bacterium]